MKTNDFSDERENLMKKSYQWEVKPFTDDNDLPKVIEAAQKDGWEVYYIDLNESKIITRKPIQVRLDD